MNSYLQDLNPQQYDAVTYTDGSSLVIAGAGSGKTKVLTCKIMYLIENGLSPKEILALTFTNKAAREMRTRISNLIGEENASQIWMGTFHSVFLRILRSHAEQIGYKNDFTIYDASDTKSIIKTIIKDMKLDEKKYAVNTVSNMISAAKNALKEPQDYRLDETLKNRDNYYGCPHIVDIYEAYHRRCQVSGAMDFDDILMYTNILFRDYPEILKIYQERFKYVLVDEYQDTNFAQHLIIRQLCMNGGHLFAVGDDAQSIYSFRGANINNILGLSKQFRNLKVFKLERNYRSTQTIVDAANSLIAKNHSQIPKNVFSKNEVGSLIPVIEAASELEEGEIVANRLFETKMLSGTKYSDSAILYRTNAQSRALEESLRKHNIPYRIYGGQAFYQRKEIKDALSYFRLSINLDDDEALCRIINYPLRGIGETTVSKLRKYALENSKSIWNIIFNLEQDPLDFHKGTITKLTKFKELIQSIYIFAQTNNAYLTVRKIYQDVGLIDALSYSSTPENISKKENLEELLNDVEIRFQEGMESGRILTMPDLLSYMSLASDQDEEDADNTDKVSLMTIHAAKGLEFKNIYIVGVEEGLFPSIRSTSTPREIEEERRLFYVAITRAKDNCTITYSRSRFRNGITNYSQRSRFISDIDAEYLRLPYNRNYRTNQSKPKATVSGSQYRNLPESAYKIGLTVDHSKYGRGKITNKYIVAGDLRVVVDFENVGTKTFVTKYAKFTIIE